jgi:hypothetical protein
VQQQAQQLQQQLAKAAESSWRLTAVQRKKHKEDCVEQFVFQHLNIHALSLPVPVLEHTANLHREVCLNRLLVAHSVGLRLPGAELCA